uniref:Uncharacterized protein n=1 Tax=Kalanchoe fedtschenkoi TaxID=63787 RepID=A0A7N0VDX5_KALFE
MDSRPVTITVSNRITLMLRHRITSSTLMLLGLRSGLPTAQLSCSCPGSFRWPCDGLRCLIIFYDTSSRFLEDLDPEEASGYIGKYTCPYLDCPFSNYSHGFNSRAKRNSHMAVCLYGNGVVYHHVPADGQMPSAPYIRHCMVAMKNRLAGKEGAYFFQESKQAVGRLVEKKASGKLPTSSASAASAIGQEAQADVLPEVLRHSLPLKLSQQQPAESTLYNYRGSKWNPPEVGDRAVSSVSRDALNPLSAYVSLPQVTFGPKRWELPDAGSSATHSTANELRRNKDPPQSSEKLKAVAEGFFLIGKAFAVATAIVFGGAALSIGWAVSKYEIHTSSDIRTKGKDIVQPKFDSIREQLLPLRNWAEDKNKRWYLEKESNIKEKPIIQELSKVLGSKPSS